jgi:hypothetical protein
MKSKFRQASEIVLEDKDLIMKSNPGSNQDSETRLAGGRVRGQLKGPG